MNFRSLEPTGFFKLSVLFILFQITMPECHKIYPNCVWYVPPEGYGLNFNSALLTKVYWNYATHIVRVCVSSISPINPGLPSAKKSNFQVNFGSKAMASLWDFLCYHSLTSTDPFFEQLLADLPTRFHSHGFNYIAYEHSSDEEMKNQSIPLTHQFLHFIPTIQLIFLKYFKSFFFFIATPKCLPRRRAHENTKGSPAENNRRPRRRARRPYSSGNSPDAASSSNCSCLPRTVQAGNSRSHCRRLKLVNKL